MVTVSLHCLNLGKAFGKRWLFRKLHHVTPYGTCLAIVGPNGSGKTTLIKMLCGLVNPTEGEIFWHFNDQRIPPKKAKAFMGVLLPECEPYDELTAFENLCLVSDLYGIPLGKARDLLEWVGLSTTKDQFVREFSSGMKVRLKLAMALLHNPPILLLDEPTAMLDQQGYSLVDEIVVTQKQRGIVVITTNDERKLNYADNQITLG